MLLQPILLALGHLSSAVSPVINAARPTIEAEIKRFTTASNAAQDKKIEVAAKYTPQFKELRGEMDSIRQLIESSSGAQETVLRGSLAEKRTTFNALDKQQSAELGCLDEEIRQAQNVIRELRSFQANGTPMSREAASAVDTRLASVNAFVFENVGEFFRNMTSPSHGGVGMPVGRDGCFGGFGTAFTQDGTLDPKLTPEEKDQLFTAVAKCHAIRLRFVGPRAVIWEKLVLAARQHKLVSELEAASADAEAV